jgi:small conductance mechanosensitive channel
MEHKMEGLRFFIEDVLSYVFAGFFLSFFTTIVFILFWVLVGIILIKIVNRFLLSLLHIRKNNRRTKTIAKLINSTTKVLVWFIVIVIVLSELGIDIAPLLASAGIIGVAVGFGAQSIVKDLLSGAFFIMEHAFFEDDLVDVNGFLGTVTQIGLRATTIKNWRGEVKMVNNGDIKDLVNYSRSDSMGALDFLLPQEVDVELVFDIIPRFLKKAKQKYKEILEEPNFFGITDVTTSGIHFRILVKVTNGTILTVQNKLRADLLLFLKQNNLAVAKQEIVYSEKKVKFDS